MAGKQVCNPQGTGYGACTGEVLPSTYNCATRVDTSCTGNTPACSGTGLWAKGYGGMLDEEPFDVVVDSAGNAVLGGYISDVVDFGCGALAAGSAGQTPVLVKLDPAGKCVWSKSFAVTGAGTGEGTTGVAVDAAGDIYALVTFTGSVDLGGGPLNSAGSSDIALAKYDANGSLQWAKRYGDTVLQTGTGIAVDPAGNVILAGGLAGTLDFGGGVTIKTHGSEDAFLAKLTSAGVPLWAKAYGDATAELALAVAVDPSGNILVTGETVGTLDFGCGTVAAPPSGAVGIFVAKVGPDGTCAWSPSYVGTSNLTGYGIASDAQGNVLVTGILDGTADLGGGPYTSLGGDDAFVLKLDPSGKYLWARFAAGTNDQQGNAVGADPFGNVVLAGTVNGSAAFSGSSVTLNSAGSGDAFLAKYDPSGNLLWAKNYGDMAAQAPRSVAFDASAHIFVAGLALGTIDFGTGMGPVCGYGGEDIFVAKLAP